MLRTIEHARDLLKTKDGIRTIKHERVTVSERQCSINLFLIQCLQRLNPLQPWEGNSIDVVQS